MPYLSLINTLKLEDIPLYLVVGQGPAQTLPKFISSLLLKVMVIQIWGLVGRILSDGAYFTNQSGTEARAQPIASTSTVEVSPTSAVA